MAMVDVDGSCHFSADSQSKSIGLVWGLAATRRSVHIHQIIRMNCRNDFGRDDSAINIVLVIIIITSVSLTLGTMPEHWSFDCSNAAKSPYFMYSNTIDGACPSTEHTDHSP